MDINLESLSGALESTFRTIRFMLCLGISVMVVVEYFVRLALVPTMALHELSILLFEAVQFFKLIAPSTRSSRVDLLYDQR
jgi:hypothetical protein